MLEVHPVHGPVHGWREFFVHITIVAIGLCLALALEELVATIHHHYQVVNARHALAQERDENRKTLRDETRTWRARVAELQNNLLVLRYLQQHPGTPRQSLPGVLIWSTSSFGMNDAVWNAAHESGVVALMPFEEIEKNNVLYAMLRQEAQTSVEATFAARDAESYNLVDDDPSHMSSEQLARAIDLLEQALSKKWLHGVMLENLAESFPDFGPTVTRDELERVRHAPDEETRKALSAARALTDERLKAAAAGSGAK